MDSRISIDGTLRNTGGVEGLELPVGDHEVCFAPVDGYLAPECQTVTLEEGVHTTASGTFVPAGTVVIVAEPEGLEPTVMVDQVERDKGTTTLTLEAGGHEICWSDEPGYTTPQCQSVVVEHSQTTTVVGVYDQTAPTPTDPATTPDEEPSDPVSEGPTDENLLTEAQHTFNSADVGWVPQGNTIVAQTDNASFDEAGALAVTVSESGPWPDGSRTARVGTLPGRDDGVPVQTDTEYSGFARVLSSSDATAARCAPAGKQRPDRPGVDDHCRRAELDSAAVQGRRAPRRGHGQPAGLLR